ncbi:dihydrolipoamide acetyltransferase family protein [Faecalibacter rhinopitheci]|uniref:Dihydrolipoamide acetyltransferase component of pyruvate dehydrogenase complex n=1 Tax=Faecalibacter rhinopitheci TaxID=2779678 RepID=A0A8J7FPZ8_9FLAO|nr:dihydrolipoamide acetyltransferase family protein [Faecalibacter rhinopitheci]MBF0595963.1 2-oxo acid dehydrogenase subunit E2 [Faecalibacter rhinopitheci]
MNKIELTIPRLGESVTEVTLSKWNVKVGDVVALDETIAEVSTDKVDSEVPSTHSGIIKELKFEEGDIIPVGEVFAILEFAEDPKTETSAEDVSLQSSEIIPEDKISKPSKFLSPLVKKIIKEENLAVDEILKIDGSGHNGRISKNDVLNYIKNPSQQKIEEVKVVSTSSSTGNSEIIEMDKMRQLISKHMKKSKQTSPHVTAYVEPDVTNLVKWREANKKAFEAKYNQKLTYTPIIVDCVVRAIKDFPMINVSVDETETKIIKHHDINIGIATALPNNNLIVPVIKSANTLNLEGLAKGVNSIVDKARNNKLSPDDISGGTFTISNVGTFGNLMGTPIINQPEVAILATGVIKKKPAVLESEYGDLVVVRQFMYLSLSFDHRVIDGSLGGVFLKRISDYMENWDINQSI